LDEVSGENQVLGVVKPTVVSAATAEAIIADASRESRWAEKKG